jgi:hypothetical protein
MPSILQRLVVSRFRMNMSPPLSGLKSKISRNRHEEFSKRVSCLSYCSALTVEATCSFETSVGRAVDFEKARQRYIPEDGSLHALTPWSESASELYRPSDRRLSPKWLPTFARRGCHVVSVTDPYGRILGFLDRSRYFSIK